jgi:excisionase family DNA binding protein
MKLLRVKEAADRLGLKPVSVRELEKRGELRAVRDWAGHRRFRDDEIDAFRERLLSGELAEGA